MYNGTEGEWIIYDEGLFFFKSKKQIEQDRFQTARVVDFLYSTYGTIKNLFSVYGTPIFFGTLFFMVSPAFAGERVKQQLKEKVSLSTMSQASRIHAAREHKKFLYQKTIQNNSVVELFEIFALLISKATPSILYYPSSPSTTQPIWNLSSKIETKKLLSLVKQNQIDFAELKKMVEIQGGFLGISALFQTGKVIVDLANLILKRKPSPPTGERRIPEKIIDFFIKTDTDDVEEKKNYGGLQLVAPLMPLLLVSYLILKFIKKENPIHVLEVPLEKLGLIKKPTFFQKLLSFLSFRRPFIYFIFLVVILAYYYYCYRDFIKLLRGNTSGNTAGDFSKFIERSFQFFDKQSSNTQNLYEQNSKIIQDKDHEKEIRISEFQKRTEDDLETCKRDLSNSQLQKESFQTLSNKANLESQTATQIAQRHQEYALLLSETVNKCYVNEADMKNNLLEFKSNYYQLMPVDLQNQLDSIIRKSLADSLPPKILPPISSDPIILELPDRANSHVDVEKKKHS